MRSVFKVLVLVVLSGTWMSMSANAQTNPPIEISKQPVPIATKTFEKYDQGSIVALGKTYPVSKVCDAGGDVSAYDIKNSDYEVAILCRGVLDGDLNYVSVFSKTKPSKTTKVKPKYGSSAITDDVFKKTVEKLVK